MKAVSGRPDLAFLTDRPGTGPFGRKATALASEFRARDRRFDAVFLEDPEIPDHDGLTRQIGLGGVRAGYATPALARYLRANRPRVALVNSGQMGPSAVLAGRLAGVPVIPWEPTFLDLDLAEATRRLTVMGAAQRFVYPRAAAIVAPSQDMVEWVTRFRGIDADHVHLLPNPIDIDRIRIEGGDQGPDPDGPFRMCAVGRLVAQKGYDVLIDALVIARDHLPQPWQLTILGREGVWRGEWGKRIGDRLVECGLSENVELAGFRPNPHAEMKRSHLLVHAARWEPFGNVLAEALALGVPVLATDCPGGPREILDYGKCGELVPNGDPEALAAGIVRLASDPERRSELAAAGTRAAERYRPGVIVDRIDEILGRIGVSNGPTAHAAAV